MLRVSQIEAMRRINNNRDIIQVTLETKKLLLEHNLNCTLVDHAALEVETGYDGIKDRTVTLLNEISCDKAVPQDTLHAVSEELSCRLEATSASKILDLINALAPMDEYLQRHCANVSLLNGLIGRWMGLPKATVDLLVLVGVVHDCGKASIPLQILDAPRRLSVAEFDIIKAHPVLGHDLLADFPKAVRLGTLAHHEKYDGRGYPGGILGGDIPLAARITTVSDIYDAMVSRRVYKEPQSPFHVMAQFSKLRGTELDPQVADVFMENMPNELVNKPVVLSNGVIGAIHAIDRDDLEYPLIRTGRQVIKSNKRLYCKAMYFQET
jgi:HD-GYP domain-containing protein (c-di-GMP phosphodiesterase class II)